MSWQLYALLGCLVLIVLMCLFWHPIQEFWKRRLGHSTPPDVVNEVVTSLKDHVDRAIEDVKGHMTQSNQNQARYLVTETKRHVDSFVDAKVGTVSSEPGKVEVAQPAAIAPLPASAGKDPFGTLPGGARVDPLIKTGTAGAVTMPKTGHVLSVPRPDMGEGVIGYAMRVCVQAGGDYKTVLGILPLYARGSTSFNSFGDGSAANWPMIVDEYFNTRAYMTQAELDRQKQAETGWTDQYAKIRG